MIGIVIALILGALGGLLAATSLESLLRIPSLERMNYRQRPVATAGGLAAFIGAALVLAILIASGWVMHRGQLVHAGQQTATAFAILASFTLLGFVDDVLGNGDDRGFRGHVRALRSGRLTTGALKMIGGAAIAILVSAVPPGSIGKHVASAALIALGANTANLFDRAPLRCVKIATLAWLPIVILAASRIAVGDELYGSMIVVAIGVGSMWGLASREARESLMLGDAGANALGAIVGYAAAATVGVVAQVVMVIALVALNVVSERTSFSAIIAKHRWLDAIDRFGSQRP